MLFNVKKSQVVIFSRCRERVTLTHFPVGPTQQLAVVSSYRYLGLWYTSDLRWSVHAAAVLKKARRSSHLISRIIRQDAPPSVRAIRSLIRGLLLPGITYGFPFWKPSAAQLSTLTSIITAPLLRVLHLPMSTHRLSVLAECGLLDMITLWEKLALSFAVRVRKLPLSHPCRALLDAQTSRNARPSLAHTVAAIETSWVVTPLECSAHRNAVRKAAMRRAHRVWSTAGKCVDLVALRAPSPRAVGVAAYILHDDVTTCAIRARLRLNRSFLNSSLYRRYVVASTACSCGAADESVSHLLACPIYAVPRAALLAGRIGRFITSRELLGEVAHLPRRARVATLDRTALFLREANRLRPDRI
jgi:hypothetical protein